MRGCMHTYTHVPLLAGYNGVMNSGAGKVTFCYSKDHSHSEVEQIRVIIMASSCPSFVVGCLKIKKMQFG